MKKFYKIFSGLVLGLCFGVVLGNSALVSAIPANVGGILNLVNGAKLMAVDGYKLVLGAQDGADGGVEVNIEGAVKYTFGESLLTSANAITVTSGAITATSGNLVATAGDVVLSTSGKTLRLQEATAGAKCMGGLTATGATPVVTATTCAETASRIFVSRTSAETGAVEVWVSAISNGVSFSVTGEAADTGTYNWIIVNEAA